MNAPCPNLSDCTGERLLLLRVFRPNLAGLIEQELERRAGVRRAMRSVPRRGRAPAFRVATPALVA